MRVDINKIFEPLLDCHEQLANGIVIKMKVFQPFQRPNDVLYEIAIRALYHKLNDSDHTIVYSVEHNTIDQHDGLALSATSLVFEYLNEAIDYFETLCEESAEYGEPYLYN